MKIEISREAITDAKEIAFYISEDNPEAARRFLEALEASISHLSSHPRSGFKKHFDHPDLEHLRMLRVAGFRNYLVCYVVDGQRLKILRIIHGRRDFPALF